MAIKSRLVNVQIDDDTLKSSMQPKEGGDFETVTTGAVTVAGFGSITLKPHVADAPDPRSVDFKVVKDAALAFWGLS